MKVLVAGGSGFIGKSFLLKANPQWDCFATYNKSVDFPDFVRVNNLKHVHPVRVDMNSPEEIESMVKRTGRRFDLCLYAMGNSDIGLSRREPAADLASNVYSLLNLLQAVQVNKFIFISSGAVYEGHTGLVNPSLPVNPTIPYSVAKLASERYIEHFQKNTDHIDNYLCLRFFGAYGPMEPSRKIYTNLTRAFFVNPQSGYTLNGDGKNYIDAMYIEDAIAGIMSMAVSDKGNKIVDYCFGQPLTVNELVYRAASAFGRGVLLGHKGSAAEYTTFYASPLEVEALFGFRPQISLWEGLGRFGKYLMEDSCQN